MGGYEITLTRLLSLALQSQRPRQQNWQKDLARRWNTQVFCLYIIWYLEHFLHIYRFLLRCLLFNCIWIWFAKHFCNFLYLPCVICNHHDTFFRSCSLGNHLHWCHCFSGGLTWLTSFFLHHHSCQISDLCRIYIVDTSIFTTFFNSDLVKSHQTVLTTWTNHTIMGVSYQSNCNFSQNSLSVIKNTDEWERRVILEKLSVGPPSLEVTRHLVAQHTKINNDLKDTILMFYFLRPFQKTPQPFLSDIFLCL